MRYEDTAGKSTVGIQPASGSHASRWRVPSSNFPNKQFAIQTSARQTFGTLPKHNSNRCDRLRWKRGRESFWATGIFRFRLSEAIFLVADIRCLDLIR